MINRFVVRKIKLNKKKAIVYVAIIMFIAIVVLFQFRKDSEITDNKIIKILMTQADLQVKNVHYTDVGDSESKWDIRADTAKYIKSDNLVIFKNVKIRLVLDKGAEFIMKGDEGRLRTDTKDIEISGQVCINSNRGEQFVTDHISYSSSDKKLYTDSQIEMENSYMKVKGTGMSLYMVNRKLILLSDVKAWINYESNENR
jgi:LPS export ABC transporter protein LptC